MCEFELPDVSLRCFVVRQLLSRIYALSSVKFSGLKLWLCKKSDKYEVCVWQTIIGHIYTYIDFNTFWCTRNLSSLRNNSINDQISTLGATSCSLGVHVHARRTINFAEPSKASERPDDSLLILLLIHLQYFLSYFSPWLEDKSHKRLLVLSLLPPKLQRRGLVFKGKMVTMKRVRWVTIECVWWVTMMRM